MRLHLVWIGKTKDRHLAALLGEYLGRIEKFCALEVSELKDQGARGARAAEEEAPRLISAVERDDCVILLDERGREMGSRDLAALIDARRQSGLRRLAFVIGGFAGAGEEVRTRADLTLALSRMTFTHEMARVILAEQIYRAFSLLAGLPYHKD